MKRNIFIIIFLFLFLVPSLSIAAHRIFYEDCEATDFSEHFLERHYGTGYQSYWDIFKSAILRSSENPHSGEYCMTYDPFSVGNPHAVVGYGSAKYGNTSGFDLSQYSGRYWYFRWYQRWETGISWTGSAQNKLLYVNYRDSGDFTFCLVRNGSENFHIQIKDHNTYSLQVNDWLTNPGGNLDNMQWHKIEVYIDVGTTGSNNGEYWLKVDDLLVKRHTGIRFNATIHANPIHFLTGWPSNISGTPTGTCRTWLDDLEIYILDGPNDIPGDEGSPDSTPTVTINTPTSEQSYNSSNNTVTIEGSTNDDSGIATISWVNSRGGSGTANNDSGDWTSWSVSNIPLQEGENVITITATDTAGQTGTDTLTVTYSPPGDTTPPTIQITGPTSESTYEINSSIINLIGTAIDNVGVSEVTWENAAGGSGTANGTTSWTIQNISLVEGENVITVTAKDNSGNTATDTITITYTVPQGTFTKTFGDSSDSDYTGTVQDTFLNINNDVNASSTSLNTYTWPTDKPANAIVMKWDLSAIPSGAQIQSATLYLYMNSMEVGGGDDQYEISVHKIINYDPNIVQCNGYTYDGTNRWTPNSQCYNNIPLAQADIAQAEDTKAIDKNTGYKTWNVTQMVRDWISDPSSNYGLLLNSDKTASADSNRTFASSEATDASRRPKLVITYTTVEPDSTPPTAPRNFSVE